MPSGLGALLVTFCHLFRCTEQSSRPPRNNVVFRTVAYFSVFTYTYVCVAVHGRELLNMGFGHESLRRYGAAV